MKKALVLDKLTIVYNDAGGSIPQIMFLSHYRDGTPYISGRKETKELIEWFKFIEIETKL